MHAADNLVEGPTLGRAQAARWEWPTGGWQDAVRAKLPLGKEAASMTVLMVYTDVLWAYTDMFTPPEDGPAVMGSWDGVKVEGVWHVARRDEVGVGAVPGTDEVARAEAADLVRKMIEERTGGRYTLKARYNLGEKDPRNPGKVLEYDSGFDVVRVKAEGKTK